MTLTLFLTTYNQYAMLHDALRTLLRHTQKPERVVVVVAGATPESTQAVSGIVQGLPVEAVFCQRNPPDVDMDGLLRQADTDCVAWCHDDVIFVPGGDRFWEYLLTPAEDPGVAVIGPSSNQTDGYQLHVRSEAPDFVKVHNIHSPMQLFRTQTYLDLGGYDLQMTHGTWIDLCIRAHVAGYCNVAARKAYIHHVGNAALFLAKQQPFVLMQDDLTMILIRKHGVRTFYDYTLRSHEWEQVVSLFGDAGFDTLTKAVSAQPEAWTYRETRCE